MDIPEVEGRNRTFSASSAFRCNGSGRPSFTKGELIIHEGPLNQPQAGPSPSCIQDSARLFKWASLQITLRPVPTSCQLCLQSCLPHLTLFLDQKPRKSLVYLSNTLYSAGKPGASGHRLELKFFKWLAMQVSLLSIHKLYLSTTPRLDTPQLVKQRNKKPLGVSLRNNR